MSANEDKLDAIRKKAEIEAAKKKSAEKRYQEKAKKESKIRAQRNGLGKWIKRIMTTTLAGGIVLGFLIYDPPNLSPSSNTQISSGSSAQEWYQGGTLHSVTIAQWVNGSYRDKLATAGDWIVGRLGDEQARDMSRLMGRAAGLVHCVDSVGFAVYTTSKDSERVNSVALACIATLQQNNWN
jgi:hypothetical protein